MSESLERRLSVLEHLKLRLHLLVCAGCARYLTQIKFLRVLLQQGTFTPANDDVRLVELTNEARQRISESLHHSV